MTGSDTSYAYAQAVAMVNAAYPVIGKDLEIVPQLSPDGRTADVQLKPLTQKGKDFIESYLSKHLPNITKKDINEKKIEPNDKA